MTGSREVRPLIGTALLKDYTLEAKFTDGGTVTIEQRP
jgi:hypothetical protein